MIQIQLYLDGEHESRMFYSSFDTLVRDMDTKFHVDDFEDVQDVIDFLNDQDADAIQDLFDVSIDTMDWEVVAS